MKREFEARRDLCRLVSTYTFLHVSAGFDPTNEAYATQLVIAKMLAPILANALAVFLNARKACREAAFLGARFRAQPEALIDSTYICRSLFSEVVVQESLVEAS